MAQVQVQLALSIIEPTITTTKTTRYEDELTTTWAESLTQISKPRYRYKKPSANDYEIYTPDIDHGTFCRCCTPIDNSYLTITEKNKLKVQKRPYNFRVKKAKEGKEEVV